MKKYLVVVTAFVVLGGWGLARSILGQQAPPGAASPFGANPRTPRAIAPADSGGFFGAGGQGAYQAAYPGAGHDSSGRSEVARLAHQLREADDDKKADLTKDLETAIDKYFDEDMQARESELTKLEERLTKLRSQMERRRKAKGEIIQLQLKVLVNEAEGLGFSGASFHEPGANWWSPMTVPGPGGGIGFGAPAKVPAPVEPARTKSTPRK